MSSRKDLFNHPHTLMRIPNQQHTARANTQTHSAFNLLKRVGFALLLLGGSVHAQTDAPINWSPVRFLAEVDSGHRASWIYGKGDTIVLISVVDTTTPYDFACARVSGDDGDTWSPLHIFERGLPFAGYRLPTVAFVSQGIVICAQTNGNSSGLFLTTDVGETWQNPSTSLLSLFIIDALRDTIYCTTGERVTWTADFGQTFAPQRMVEGWPGLEDGAVSNGSFHLVRATDSENPNQHLVHVYGPRLEGEFTAPLDLNPNMFWTSRGIVDFSDDGTGMIAANVCLSEPILGPATVMRYVTRDDGRSWLEIDTLAVQTGYTYRSWVANSENQWVYVWQDTVRDPHFESAGMWYQFSADDGRAWYPARQCASLFSAGTSGGPVSIDFSSNKINILCTYRWWNGVYGDYYAEIEGIVAPDSIPPIIAALSLPPDTVAVHDTLCFRVSADDNDTIFVASLQLVDAVNGDTMSMNLDRTGMTEYETNWDVGQEGRYLYWFESEDFWNHVTRLPEIGSYEFVTEGWSSLSEESDIVQDWSIEAFPNPFNSTTTLRLNPPIGTRNVTLTVSNILGQQVEHREIEVLAPQIEIQLTADNWPSGIYIARAEALNKTQTTKLVLLK